MNSRCDENSYNAKISYFSISIVYFPVFCLSLCGILQNYHLMEKEELKAREKKIAEMAIKYCKEYIDEEYALLCEKMVQKLGRKRTKPLERGRLEIWAAAVVYTVGTINFLFDKSFLPYVPSSDIYDYFGAKASTVNQKSGQIRQMLKLSYHWDKDFSTQYMVEHNPFAYTHVMINGIPL